MWERVGLVGEGEGRSEAFWIGRKGLVKLRLAVSGFGRGDYVGRIGRRGSFVEFG